jgi:hypothetical protein
MQGSILLWVVPPRVCAALLCLAAAGVSFGQFETATVLGTATNERAGAIPQARVSLANLDTGTSQSTVSDDIGNYQFLEVRVGRYRVIAESPGFKKLETAEFRVDVGARTLINACVRSGTNQLHGTVWEFLHNTDLNATGFFKPVGGQKPVYIQNQFGGAAGGPIKKDKLFVFAELSTYKGESQ